MLIVQCLRGTEIGQVKIEQMNEEYYYFYKNKEFEDSKFEERGNILFIQYKPVQKGNNETKMECCGMAFGDYNREKSDDCANELLIVHVKRINFSENKNISSDNNANKEYLEMYEEIIKKNVENDRSAELTYNNSYYISQVNDTDEKINNLKGYVEKEIEENELEKIQKLYKKFLTDETEYNNDNNFTEEERKKYKEIFECYDKLERTREKNFSPLGQRSVYARRVINKGNRRPNRTEYQRDWERVIHSKSFRRLEDKAQIYTLSKGDHFRTRLTHSLEVTQIARGIARELNLNEDLVEAIALAHDLGHTPFGHVGERTLNEILKDEGVEGGFKHNFQGVKVVNYLEEKYGEFEGMDLTYQVMEGILKHTKICDCDYKESCPDSNKIKGLNCEYNFYNIDKFLCNGKTSFLHPEYNFATTVEGQIVAIADEIAQRAHDLDDGIASKIIDENKLLVQLKDMAKRNLKDIVDNEFVAELFHKFATMEDAKKELKDTVRNTVVDSIKKKISESKEIHEKQKKEFGDILDNEMKNISNEETAKIVKKEFINRLRQSSIEKCKNKKVEIKEIIEKIKQEQFKCLFENEYMENIYKKYIKNSTLDIINKLENICSKDYLKVIKKCNESKAKNESDRDCVAKKKEKKDLLKLEEMSLNKQSDYAKMKIENELGDLSIEILMNLSNNKLNEFIEKKNKELKIDIIKIAKTNFEKEVQNEEYTTKVNDIADFEDELYIKIKKSLNYIDEDKRDYIDDLDIKRARIVSDVITFFIKKIRNDSQKKILEYKIEGNSIENGIIDKQLIKFTGSLEKIRGELEQITSNKIINSEEVNCFDGKGKYIIRKLYKAYTTNPKQMSNTTIKRIEREISKFTNDKFDICKMYINKEGFEKEYEVYKKYIDGEKNAYASIKVKKHKVFVRCLIDLIAGMTDEFANKQFEKLYYARTY